MPNYACFGERHTCVNKLPTDQSVHDSEIAGSRTCRLATFQSQFRRPASPRHTISTCVYRIYTRQQPQSPNRLRASTNKLSMSRRRLVQLNRRRKRQLVACGAAWCLQAGHVHNSTCPCLRCQITRRAKLTKMPVIYRISAFLYEKLTNNKRC